MPPTPLSQPLTTWFMHHGMAVLGLVCLQLRHAIARDDGREIIRILRNVVLTATVRHRALQYLERASFFQRAAHTYGVASQPLLSLEDRLCLEYCLSDPDLAPTWASVHAGHVRSLSAAAESKQEANILTDAGKRQSIDRSTSMATLDLRCVHVRVYDAIGLPLVVCDSDSATIDAVAQVPPAGAGVDAAPPERSESATDAAGGVATSR